MFMALSVFFRIFTYVFIDDTTISKELLRSIYNCLWKQTLMLISEKVNLEKVNNFNDHRVYVGLMIHFGIFNPVAEAPFNHFASHPTNISISYLQCIVAVYLFVIEKKLIIRQW